MCNEVVTTYPNCPGEGNPNRGTLPTQCSKSEVRDLCVFKRDPGNSGKICPNIILEYEVAAYQRCDFCESAAIGQVIQGTRPSPNWAQYPYQYQPPGSGQPQDQYIDPRQLQRGEGMAGPADPGQGRGAGRG
jgi:hypothetical protein